MAASGGLTSAEAVRRRETDGPNELPRTPPPPWWRLLGAQLTHFFALMLWVASVGWAVAVLAIPAVLAADGVHKRQRRRVRTSGRT